MLNFLRFIEFLHEWNAKENKSEYLDIAYSAERSVQDEIEKLSESEVNTIIISYVVMFVYITIALGRFRSFKTLMVRQHIFITH